MNVESQAQDRKSRTLHGPWTQRAQDIEAARRGVDLLIIGGGITGAGAARDAIMRGLSVAIVEKDDWAAGTSSKSSKLVHGGFRYLETYQFGLVMESTRERHRQLKLNPHLVSPLPFVMPVYEGDRHGLLKLDIGLWLYDLLALLRTPRIHRRLNPTRVHQTVAALRTDKLKGGLLYYDCAVDDARLTLANVLDARRQGALAFSRMAYRGPSFAQIQGQKRVQGANVYDALTDQTLFIPCRHILHATGPWTDETGAMVGDPARLRPTKGVHIVVSQESLPLETAVVMNAPQDGRIVFAIPYQNTTYIGTTDTDYSGDLNRVVADADDIAYLIETARHFFPDHPLQPSDIRSTWAGLRPLIHTEGKSAYETSREHVISRDERGLTTIAGGKLTTYRAMAKEVVQVVVRDLKQEARRLNAPKLKLRRAQTHRIPLDAEAFNLPRHITGEQNQRDRQLWQTHGRHAEDVRARLKAHPEELRPMVDDLEYIDAQIAIAALYEDAWKLEDLMVRRFQIFYRSADCGLSAAPRIAARLAELLGRDAAWVQGEVEAYEAYVADQLAGIRSPTESPLTP